MWDLIDLSVYMIDSRDVEKIGKKESFDVCGLEMGLNMLEEVERKGLKKN